MNAMKASWTVKCAVLASRLDTMHRSDPSMNEVVEHFTYTSADYEADAALPAEAERTTFMDRMDAAHQRAKELTDPRGINFVRVDFVWY